MPITLYHCINARSFRVLWMLEELGLPYTLEVLPFPPRSQRETYLEVNPLGTIPTFFDDGMRMTESAAICQYLAARHSPRALDVAADEADFGPYLNFLHFGETTLSFPQTLILRYGRFEPPARRQPQVVEDYTRWFLSRLRTLEPLLERREFLCAGRFTAADVAVGYALMLADDIGLRERFKPATLAYWERLQQREGFQRALDAQARAARAQGVPTESVARSDGR
ncbi:MAG: glutathione S-transferase family protein [Thauera phenolivorans]|uniref:Glutathione S-transferase family protein n=1 Tax=Thauera phenolivorans TaxID=1792543 RepID=A0A7X7R7Y8_9RHOO|nr:glutathione S-transferase family protein [Thauera phenolivorans]